MFANKNISTMTINNRIEQIIEKLYKGNKRAFATAIGVAPTVIENVVGTRQGKPSYGLLEKYAQLRVFRLHGLLLEKGPC